MKQSLAILALFLGMTSAVQLNAWGDDKKDEKQVAPPEKVHNLKPTHAQDLSNNLDPDYPTFPQPIGLGAGRTAFYAQTEEQNVAEKRNKHKHHKHHKARDVGDQGIAEEVQQFVTNDKSVLPQPWRRAKEAYPKNGFKNPSWQYLPQKKHHHHHKARDVGDQGIAEEVQQFVTNDKSVLPQPWRRVKEAYPKNGFKNPSWQYLPQKKHHHKHHHKARDVGDQGIAEEVQQFVTNDKSVLPQPWRRVKEAYPANGFKNPQFQWVDKKSLVQQNKRDIGDQGIVEEVQGFASADKSVLPKPWRRAKEPYPQNGFLNPTWQWLDKPEDKKASLAQKEKQDIGDKKINEAVHGFINADNSMHPTPYPREEHAINGHLNPEFQHLS